MTEKGVETSMQLYSILFYCYLGGDGVCATAPTWRSEKTFKSWFSPSTMGSRMERRLSNLHSRLVPAELPPLRLRHLAVLSALRQNVQLCPRSHWRKLITKLKQTRNANGLLCLNSIMFFPKVIYTRDKSQKNKNKRTNKEKQDLFCLLLWNFSRNKKR